MYEKLKSFLAQDTFFFAVLLVLIAVISFGLGKRSVEGEVGGSAAELQAGVIFTESTIAEPIASPDSIQVVGSRSGTKYHLFDCPGPKQIKEENKVFFDSIELAKAAGYMPAANCPGLQ